MNLNDYEFWRKNKRYLKALLAGFVSSLVCAIGIALLVKFVFLFLPTFFGVSFLYVGAGYIIGESIRRFGHGVGKRFYVTAAVFTVVCIILSEYLITFGFQAPSLFALRYLITISIQPTVNNLIKLIWYIAACGIAFRKAETA